MAYQNIANAIVTLDTTVSQRASFSYPMFMAAHRYFPERIRVYNSLAAVQEDVPAGSPAYKALSAALSQLPRPSLVYLGRREADASLAPTGVAVGKVYTVTVTVNDGDAVAVSYTAVGGNTAQDVAAALKAAIDANAAVNAHVDTAVVGTGASATLTIEATTAADVFSLSNLSANLVATYTSTEAPADTLAAIEEENNDWYVVAADDHSESYVLALAEAVEARTKLYLTSVAGAANLVATADPVAAGDILSQLKDQDYFRTAALYHQDADTEFPEMAYAGRFLTYAVGTEAWENKQLAGVGVSRDPVSDKKLTVSQKNVLEAKNVSYVDVQGGVNVVRGGRVAAGEWIDIIRLRDAIVDQVEADQRDLLLRSSKIGYTDFGIAKVVATLSTSLDQFVETAVRPGGLEAGTPYKIFFKRASEITPSQKGTRVLNSVRFDAFLSGGIRIVEITGSLQYSGAGA